MFRHHHRWRYLNSLPPRPAGRAWRVCRCGRVEVPSWTGWKNAELLHADPVKS